MTETYIDWELVISTAIAVIASLIITLIIYFKYLRVK